MRSNLLRIKLSVKDLIHRRTTQRIDNVRLFVIALLLSFVGSIPPGTTNLLTVHLVVEKGVSAGMMFAIGCLLAELVAVSASVVLVDRMLKFRRVTRFLQLISLMVLLTFAIASFVAASRDQTYQSSMITGDSSPFVLGFIMMIINPVQLPFWLGWTALLVERKVIRSGGLRSLAYVVGAGAGSGMASVCFIWLGKFFITEWSLSPLIFYSILGTLFLASFLLQLARSLVSGALVRR